MAESPESGGSSGPSQANPNPGESYVGGVEYITAIGAEASGDLGAAATQIFTTPTADRRRVTITNCEATAGVYLYVGHSSSLSATVFRKRLDALESITINAGPGCPIFLFGTAGNTLYYAVEEIAITE